MWLAPGTFPRRNVAMILNLNAYIQESLCLYFLYIISLHIILIAIFSSCTVANHDQKKTAVDSLDTPEPAHELKSNSCSLCFKTTDFYSLQLISLSLSQLLNLYSLLQLLMAKVLMHAPPVLQNRSERTLFLYEGSLFIESYQNSRAEVYSNQCFFKIAYFFSMFIAGKMGKTSLS